MTPCDIDCHVLCCTPDCGCPCHDDAASATTDAVVAAAMRRLDDELAQLMSPRP